MASALTAAHIRSIVALIMLSSLPATSLET
jgi:hypothetical protein